MFVCIAFHFLPCGIHWPIFVNDPSTPQYLQVRWFCSYCTAFILALCSWELLSLSVGVVMSFPLEIIFSLMLLSEMFASWPTRCSSMFGFWFMSGCVRWPPCRACGFSPPVAAVQYCCAFLGSVLSGLVVVHNIFPKFFGALSVSTSLFSSYRPNRVVRACTTPTYFVICWASSSSHKGSSLSGFASPFSINNCSTTQNAPIFIGMLFETLSSQSRPSSYLLSTFFLVFTIFPTSKIGGPEAVSFSVRTEISIEYMQKSQ